MSGKPESFDNWVTVADAFSPALEKIIKAMEKAQKEPKTQDAK